MATEKINVNNNLRLYVSENDGTYGRFELVNLSRGFANTIGNSLRRVLLSSIEGTGITVIKKIELNDQEIVHEFRSLVGVKESVPEIIFNLKKLIFTLDEDIYPEKQVVLEIDFSKAGNCYGKDIKLPTGVTLLNPEQYLFQLADSAIKLYIQFQLEKGVGYVSSETNKFRICSDRKDAYVVNTVYLDTDFSPVKRVAYETVELREQNRIYDKLKLEIWTNGAYDPFDALKSAAKILISDLAIFIDAENYIIEKPEIEEVLQIEEKKDENQGLIYLSDLEISVRSKNCLENTPIKTLQDLAEHTAQELLEIKNFGHKSLSEVRELLAQHGMKLKGE